MTIDGVIHRVLCSADDATFIHAGHISKQWCEAANWIAATPTERVQAWHVVVIHHEWKIARLLNTPHLRVFAGMVSMVAGRPAPDGLGLQRGTASHWELLPLLTRLHTLFFHVDTAGLTGPLELALPPSLSKVQLGLFGLQATHAAGLSRLLTALTTLPVLESLHLRFMPSLPWDHIADEVAALVHAAVQDMANGMAALARAPSRLHVQGVDGWSPACIDAFRVLPGLTDLDIFELSCDDAMLGRLLSDPVPQLVRLTLPIVTDAHAAHLPRCLTLGALNTNLVGFTQPALLAQLLALHTIALRCSAGSMDGAPLAAGLGACMGLTSVALAGSRMTSDEVATAFAGSALRLQSFSLRRMHQLGSLAFLDQLALPELRRLMIEACAGPGQKRLPPDEWECLLRKPTLESIELVDTIVLTNYAERRLTPSTPQTPNPDLPKLETMHYWIPAAPLALA